MLGGRYNLKARGCILGQTRDDHYQIILDLPENRINEEFII